MRHKLMRLQWDSDFLGFNTYRIDFDGSEQLPVNDFISALRKANAVLTYIFIPHGKESLVKDWENAGARLVDTKVVFQSNVDDRSNISGGPIHSFSVNDELPHRLRDIALVSGQHSRFLTDPQMPEGTYERLYNLWLKRSLSREIADEVLVSEEDRSITGFVTIALQADIAVIGLIAVDPATQGRGIGAQLIGGVFEYAANNKCTALQVATQLDNIGACRFYERLGFTELRRRYVLHFWSNA
ncbi:GNAT family N-acetyltransferase [bacterium]|nr:GNAT family N-acetyltransferase [bacterium]